MYIIKKSSIISFIFFIHLIFTSLSCNEIVDPTDNLKINCDRLRIGIFNLDKIIVNNEINKLTADLFPSRIKNGNLDQRNNLLLLIERIERNCSNLDAELLCYACIEIFPPLSEILIVIDSAGVQINRVIDIKTPHDSNLKCVGVHRF